MKLVYTFHYEKNKKYRPEITEHMIEYCIINSYKKKDRRWLNVYNAIYNVPPSNRLLKVVYKIQGKSIKVITAYWMY